MPVFGGNVALDRDPHISEVPASMGEMIGATAREAWHGSPTMEALGIDELARAKGDTKGPIDRALDIGEQSPVALVAPIATALKTAKRAAEWIGGYDTAPAPTKELTSADARARVDDAGLSKMITLGDEPIREGALDIMIKRANERHMRETTMARGPSGFTAGVFSVGTSLFVGALDPLNIGAAFIPIVGEARWGKLMYSAGESAINRAGVRFGLGAAQGAAFTAAFQPLEAWAHTQEGRDFTMAEALHNVLMGAGTFGLLHVGGGVAADVYRGFRGRPLYPHGEGEPMGPAAVPHTATRETDPRLSIFNETYANLRTAGMEADEAAQNASVVAERYATRAERIGAEPYELFRSEGIDIQSGASPVSTDARSFEQARALPMDEESRLGRARELGFNTDKVWYHGTARADRLTEKGRIDPKRATSGPMPYFTDDPALGSSYATKKVDTSLEVPDDYAGWFKYKPPGARTAVDIDRAWYHLDPETRRTVAERLPDIKEDEFGGKITYEKGQGHPAGDLKAWNEHYLPREGRGNPLRAAKEIWLNGGILFNDEERFLEVLKLAGMKDVEFDSPHRQQPGVLPAYIRARNPLDTSNVEQLQALLPELQSLARRSRRPPQIGADMWAKVATSVRMWLDRFEEDLKNGTTHAWTSIPDEVTKFLESKGFDAVLDTGGKMGGPRHAVLIPFRPQQVRSIFARFDQEKADSPKILDQAAKPPGADLFTQREAEGQTSLPGTDRIKEGEQAQRAADQPLKPKVVQKPMDVGLFGDESKQKSFFQAPTFYSTIERTVTDAKQEKASPEQWLGMIKNAAGVKAEELEWLGLEPWLKEQSGPVTKQQLADYVRANRIEVKEKERGARPRWELSELARDLLEGDNMPLQQLRTVEDVETARRHNSQVREATKDYTPEQVIAAAEEARDASKGWQTEQISSGPGQFTNIWRVTDPDGGTHEASGIRSADEAIDQVRYKVQSKKDTKFTSWMTPKGLENERELVLTLPQKSLDESARASLEAEHQSVTNEIVAINQGPAEGLFERRSPLVTRLRAIENRLSGVSDAYRVPAGHGYGDEASDINRLAHIFTADATIDGKKTLLIREGQSDWHQAGHKQGYKTAGSEQARKSRLAEIDAELGKIAERADQRPRGGEVPEYRELTARIHELQGERQGLLGAGVPDAPFKTTWPALVLKRMIRYASEHGSPGSPRFIEVTKPEGVRKLGEDVLGTQVASMVSLNEMDGGVLAALKYDQVKKSVAAALPVDVVDSLAGVKATPDDLLRNPDVIILRLSVDHRGPVANGLLGALRSVGAVLRTKLLVLRSAGGDVNLLPTLNASDLSAREVVGLLSPQTVYHVGLPSGARGSDVAGAGAKLRSGVGGGGEKLDATALADYLNRHAESIGETGASYQAPSQYDKLAWVTGDTVAERYDLSKQVDKINWARRRDGTHDVTVHVKDGERIERDGLTDEQLADLIGKEPAEKIIKATPQPGPSTGHQGIGSLEGLDLKVGGEFHRKLYDDVFVREANKLVKKYGVKVEEGKVAADPTTFEQHYEGPELTYLEILRRIQDAPENLPNDIFNQLRNIAAAVNTGRTEYRDAVERYASAGAAEILGGKFIKPETKLTVHTLPITPELRKAAVEQGFSLFQKGGEGAEPRGRITLDDNKAIVQLFAKANASTFMHEMGHLWLEEMMRDAAHEKATAGVKSDLKTILSWLGVEKPEDVQTSQHEQWARGFEQYLREGSAPSQELAGAFAKFKAWLTAIYRALADLGTPITDDIRGVMDRMLATDEQIKAYRERRPSPAVEILADLPPRAKADIAQGGIASLINGEPVRVGEMIEAGAARDPRIQESIDRAGQSEDVSRETLGDGEMSRPSQPSEISQPSGTSARASDVPEDEITTKHIGAKATRGPRARDPDSWSLLEFIAAHGGIDPTDALIGDVRALFGGKRRFIPGFGDIVRKGGMRLDRAREAAVEAGYLHDPGWNTDKQATTTISDLLEAMDSDNRGQKVYKHDRLPEHAQNVERTRVIKENLRDAENRFDDHLVDADMDPTVVDPKLYKRTLEIMTREGESDPALAFERAIMEDEEHYDKAANVRRSEVPHIPGWDAQPDDARAAPGRGGEAAAGGRELPRRPEALRAGEGTRAGGEPDRAVGGADESTVTRSAWRDLSRPLRPADEPDVIAASERAAALPEPASLAPEPDKRVAAAEKAAAEAEAVYNAAAPYLPEDIKAIVERRMLELDREGEDSTHVLQQGAACLAAAVGVGA